MGQKIHPIGFRLGVTKNHQSQWFTNSIFYPNLIVEDYFIRKNLSKEFSQNLRKDFPNVDISNIEIQRKFNDQIQITLYGSRFSSGSKPRELFTQNQAKKKLQKLRKSLTIQIKKYRKTYFRYLIRKAQNLTHLYSIDPKITIQFFDRLNPNTNAYCLSNFLVEQLQKRVAFRRVIKQVLRRAQKTNIQGIKIQISGRLNGAEIARSEWVRKGRIPLQTLRADISYCYRSARTIFGILGIKVWIFKS